MLFNSFSFLIYFPIVTLLYFFTPGKWRWLTLVAASCIFYMWLVPKYILILWIAILIDYLAGLLIEKSEDQKAKQFWLVLSVISTCLILFVFKYYNFFIDNASAALSAIGLKYPLPILEILLPVGLSFHTFQSLSYVIEVYRGNQKAEKHLGIYSLYVLFYPQLVAGPIERPQNLLHQFHVVHKFNSGRLYSGLRLMAWGFVKKVAIADQLAPFVNEVYKVPQHHSSPVLILATIAFAFQIYCDFSGYSAIARGSARVMGYDLMQNFRNPYASKSITEFWRRWHISLSTWFRDYIYIPLGGNRVSFLRQQFNLMITFVISGIWHGANWTFLYWGALNGMFIIISNFYKRIYKPDPNTEMSLLESSTRLLATFLIICATWVFFRSKNLGDAFYILRSVFSTDTLLFTNYYSVIIELRSLPATVGSLWELSQVLVLMAGVFVVEAIHESEGIDNFFESKPVFLKWAAYNAAVATAVLASTSSISRSMDFIYFQF